MGADLLAISFSVPNGCSPNWERAHKFISSLSAEDMSTDRWKDVLDGTFEDECLAQDDGTIPVGLIRDRLHVNLDLLEENMNGRSITYIGDSARTHYLAAGFSWGDDPSEAFGFMRILAETGVLEYLGAEALKCVHHVDITIPHGEIHHVLGIYFIPETGTFIGLDVSNPNETLPSPYNPGYSLKLPENTGKEWPIEITPWVDPSS